MIDGSVSKAMRDNAFVSCKVLKQKQKLETLFLEVHAPTDDEARGMFECLITIFNPLKNDTKMLAGIITGG